MPEEKPKKCNKKTNSVTKYKKQTRKPKKKKIRDNKATYLSNTVIY